MRELTGYEFHQVSGGDPVVAVGSLVGGLFLANHFAGGGYLAGALGAFGGIGGGCLGLQIGIEELWQVQGAYGLGQLAFLASTSAGIALAGMGIGYAIGWVMDITPSKTTYR